jgi:hypothetical protein
MLTIYYERNTAQLVQCMQRTYVRAEKAARLVTDGSCIHAWPWKLVSVSGTSALCCSGASVGPAGRIDLPSTHLEKD